MFCIFEALKQSKQRRIHEDCSWPAKPKIFTKLPLAKKKLSHPVVSFPSSGRAAGIFHVRSAKVRKTFPAHNTVTVDNLTQKGQKASQLDLREKMASDKGFRERVGVSRMWPGREVMF